MEKKEISYNQYVHGDFDKDGTPNIDDKKPFDAKDDRQVSEVSLSDELKKIDKNNQSYKDFVISVKKRFPRRKVQYRIKNPHSTIGKLRRKFLHKVEDIAGMRIICKSEKDINQVASQLHRMYKVISDQNYYDPTQRKVGNKYYMARHITISIRDHPIEIQLKTKAHSALHDKTHPLYKQYGKLPRSDYMRLLHQAEKIRRMEG